MTMVCTTPFRERDMPILASLEEAMLSFATTRVIVRLPANARQRRISRSAGRTFHPVHCHDAAALRAGR